ncbi:MAG: peptidase [Cytophagaceae bacterium]|nr:peptidase [Cytophagaceae bacterium]MDW8455333.1 peptidase [Cytophagaceae bacterium]
MTYCLGIKLRSGLVAIADTRITSGNETTTAKKIYVYRHERQSLFIMTSGLRSVRDKAVTYFQEALEEHGPEFNKVYKAVNAFGTQLRRVAGEDKAALESAGFHFNLNAIVGGQLNDDDEHKLYLIYPEGNWVEIGEHSPFVIIGNSGYGKPILNRTLTYDSAISVALKAGFLSFDSTRVSANDVEFPIDVVLYKRGSYHIAEHRFEKEDLAKVSEFWDQQLQVALKNIPEEWMDVAIKKMNK